MTDIFWPGRDYPDREKWLAKRCTPRPFVHASSFYDPHKEVASARGHTVVQGPYNPGINKMKARVRYEMEGLKGNTGVPVISMDERGQLQVQINKHPKRAAARRAMLDLRRKAQRQGHVTVEKNMGPAQQPPAEGIAL